MVQLTDVHCKEVVSTLKLFYPSLVQAEVLPWQDLALWMKLTLLWLIPGQGIATGPFLSLLRWIVDGAILVGICAAVIARSSEEAK